MELVNGQPAWYGIVTYSPLGEIKAHVTGGTVEHAEGRLIRCESGYLLRAFNGEGLYPTEAEARLACAAELEATAQRITALAREERAKAEALVAAKESIVYV